MMKGITKRVVRSALNSLFRYKYVEKPLFYMFYSCVILSFINIIIVSLMNVKIRVLRFHFKQNWEVTKVVFVYMLIKVK